MARAGEHTIGYRVWNQTRVSMYAKQSFQIYNELLNYSYTPESRGPLERIRMAIYQYLLIQLATVEPNSGVSLKALISEAQKDGMISETDAAGLLDPFRRYETVLKNVVVQRSNISAHRSPKRSFAYIVHQFPVPHDDLEALVNLYYDTACRLNSLVPFNRAWAAEDHAEPMKHILESLGCQRLPERISVHADLVPKG